MRLCLWIKKNIIKRDFINPTHGRLGSAGNFQARQGGPQAGPPHQPALTVLILRKAATTTSSEKDCSKTILSSYARALKDTPSRLRRRWIEALIKPHDTLLNIILVFQDSINRDIPDLICNLVSIHRPVKKLSPSLSHWTQDFCFLISSLLEPKWGFPFSKTTAFGKQWNMVRSHCRQNEISSIR